MMIRTSILMAALTLVACNGADNFAGDSANKSSSSDNTKKSLLGKGSSGDESVDGLEAADRASGGVGKGGAGTGGADGSDPSSNSSSTTTAGNGTGSGTGPGQTDPNAETWNGVNPGKGVPGENGPAQNGGPNGGVGNGLRPHSDGDKPFSGVPIGDGAAGLTRDLNSNEKQQLKSCLALWAHHHPFDPNRVRPDKIVTHLELGPLNKIFDAITGTEFSGITDTKVTDKPALIFVPLSINLLAPGIILPPVAYNFLNPNGWYCIGGNFDLASSVVVNLKRGAHLAESRFNLAIISSMEPISRVGISILSRSKVVEVP